VALIFARKKSRAVEERALAPGRFPSTGDQRTNDTRFPPSPRHRGDGDAPHLPSVTNYPVPPRHPRAESRLMSYSRERGPPGSGEETGRLRRQVNNKRMRKKLLEVIRAGRLIAASHQRFEIISRQNAVDKSATMRSRGRRASPNIRAWNTRALAKRACHLVTTSAINPRRAEE